MRRHGKPHHLFRHTALVISAALIAAVLSTVEADPRGPRIVGHEIVAGDVLVAGLELNDLNFGESVVFVLKHDADGTQGLILNRSMGIPARDALPNLADVLDARHPMYFGGPVEAGSVRVLIGTDTPLPGATAVTDGVALVNDVGVLRMSLMDRAPEELRFFAGYAGWAPGQLEKELDRGDWHVRERYRDVLFDDTPETMWRELIEEVSGLLVHHENHVR